MRHILVSYILFIISAVAALSQESATISGSTLTISSPIPAETPQQLRESALKIFLDCRWCDRDYIKRVIPFVNYVNNKDEADVHILVRRQVTGGGGGEYSFSFIGQGRFAGIDDELIFFSSVDETRNETRQGRSGTIAMGLMQYVARTPIGKNIRISYEDMELPGRTLSSVVEDDPWDSWIFRLRSYGRFNRDENYNRSNISASFGADRITEKWKLEFDAGYSFNQTIYASDEIDPYFRRNWNFRTLLVKSIGDHWAAGVKTGTVSDTYNNYDLLVTVGPALEYNFFPYDMASEKQLRIQYGINAIYNDYTDTTSYLMLQETRFSQSLSASIGFNQPWGSGDLSITTSHFLHDISLNRITIRGDLNYRIYKGLSVSFEPRASLIHDQINLRMEDPTTQDILTQQRALKSGYDISIEIGFTYSFGSIYNNVVNPRFSYTGRY
ncbi:MAG: hypothetical protein LC649_05470 [Bacteroidales bacterium]|nr:hypothetical protein [Bacteroidales bacterium]